MCGPTTKTITRSPIAVVAVGGRFEELEVRVYALGAGLVRVPARGRRLAAERFVGLGAQVAGVLVPAVIDWQTFHRSFVRSTSRDVVRLPVTDADADAIQSLRGGPVCASASDTRVF